MSIHDGRRQRQKDRFCQYGLENFSDVEALELLLYYALPQGDTNPIAHELLRRFHSFKGVLEARPEDLKTVPGIKENAATLLSLIPAISRRYLTSSREDRQPVSGTEDAGRLLIPEYAFYSGEVALAMLLDPSHHVICIRRLGEGTSGMVDFSPRRLIEMVLSENAAAVILSHNHITGSALPSNEDLKSTKKISEALKLLGVALLDHIIVCDNDYVSLHDCGMM